MALTTQIGVGSWYGGKFSGRLTKSGEPFNPNSLTAAHRDFPMGSHVKVTNLHNDRTVVVRINDYGPARHDRIIDLSYKAAEILHIDGLAKVKLELL